MVSLTPHNYISSGRTSHPFAPTSLSLLFMSLLLWKLVNQPAKQWKILKGAFFLIKTTLLCEFDWWIRDGIKFSWWHKSELPTSQHLYATATRKRISNLNVTAGCQWKHIQLSIIVPLNQLDWLLLKPESIVWFGQHFLAVSSENFVLWQNLVHCLPRILFQRLMAITYCVIVIFAQLNQQGIGPYTCAYGGGCQKLHNGQLQ